MSFGPASKKEADQRTSIAKIEPEFETLRIHHVLGEEESVKMKLLVDEELASFLLPFVATGYPDHAPDGVVGGLFRYVNEEREDGRRGEEWKEKEEGEEERKGEPCKLMQCWEELVSLPFSSNRATA